MPLASSAPLPSVPGTLPATHVVSSHLFILVGTDLKYWKISIKKSYGRSIGFPLVRALPFVSVVSIYCFWYGPLGVWFAWPWLTGTGRLRVWVIGVFVLFSGPWGFSRSVENSKNLVYISEYVHAMELFCTRNTDIMWRNVVAGLSEHPYNSLCLLVYFVKSEIDRSIVLISVLHEEML